MGKPKIVISPLFNNESSLGVLVTKSFSSLVSPQQDPLSLFYGSRIGHGRICIANEGMTHELTGISPVFFSEDIQLRPYSLYSLTVLDSQTGEFVKATTTMLPRVKLNDIAMNMVRRDKDTSLKVTVRLYDDRSAKRYYLVTFKLNEQDPLPPKHTFARPSLYSQIELFDNSKASDGQLAFEKTYNSSLISFDGRDSVVVEISEVSEAYYNYLVIYKKTASLINQLTGEPINLPSNVEGGTGFFFLLNPDYREFELENL
jgi:hypothetical protein